jgi:DNA excision repair protein ERCC-1
MQDNSLKRKYDNSLLALEGYSTDSEESKPKKIKIPSLEEIEKCKQINTGSMALPLVPSRPESLVESRIDAMDENNKENNFHNVPDQEAKDQNSSHARVTNAEGNSFRHWRFRLPSPTISSSRQTPPPLIKTDSRISTCCSINTSRRVISSPNSTSTMSPRVRSLSTLLINERQRGNPLIKYIKNVKYEFDSTIVPDFVLGLRTCALFLSLQYHVSHTNYIFERIKKLPARYRLRILLVLVDIEENATPLRQINKIAVDCNLTLILSWSNREAARYVETFKAYEFKTADSIKEPTLKGDYMTQLTDCLTSIRSVNRQNVLTLKKFFGSLRSIMSASLEQLSVCPGIGEKKMKRIYDAFHKPFVSSLSPLKGIKRIPQYLSTPQSQSEGTSPPSSNAVLNQNIDVNK